MTSQGSPGGRFERAVSRGQLFHAELAAREMGKLSLGHALALCQLFAEADDPRFERAAVRWHGRLVLERRVVTLADSQLILAALVGLKEVGGDAGPLVLSLAARYGADLGARKTG